ncbi:MAG TPA: extracellular solute-binding protein [Anaerolineae bacterium]|nr:extracellular solute-binding protein [Anaerolineae bacterium]
MSVKRSLFLAVALVLVLAACGPTPAPQTVVQTVEVEKTVVQTVEVEKTVIETVEVEVPVVETVVVEAEKPLQLSFAGHEYFNLSFGPAPAPLEGMRTAVTEKWPNTEIQLIMQPLDANKWHDNLVTYFVAQDQTVDLLYLAGYWVTEFGAADWLVPLDELLEPELLDKYGEAYKEVFTYDGKLIGLGPAWGGIGGLYYRKDLLEAAGLEPPQTYDDIIAACDAIMAENADIGCWDWPAMRNVVLVNRWSEYLHGFGGTYVNEDGTCAMNSPEAVAALEYMTMLFEEGYSPQESLSWKEEDAHVRFVNGQTIFLSARQDLLFWIDDPERSKVVDNWGFIPNPAQEGGRHSGFTEFWAFAISKFSDNPEEALEVLKTWGEFPTMKLFNLAWGPLQGYTEVYSDPDVIANNKYLPLIEEVGDTALAPMPSANYGEVADILQAEIHSALSGLSTPQEALDNACEAIDAIETGP